MGGGDLNSKKSWHPNTIKNQERVWKAEQAAAEEKKRIMELQCERAAERDRAELNDLAKRNAGASSNDNRLHWMYDKPDKKVHQEDYLLGKAIDKGFDKSEKSDDVIPAVARRVVGSSMSTAAVGDQQVDLARKIREDPLLLVKERERAARAALLNNPLQRKRLTEMLRKEQEQQKERKSEKKPNKKEKELDNVLTAKLNALGADKGVDIAALLASDGSSSDSESTDEERKKHKKKSKKKEKSKKSKKKAKSESDSDSSSQDRRKKEKKKHKETTKHDMKGDKKYSNKTEVKDKERSKYSSHDSSQNQSRSHDRDRKRRSESSSDREVQNKRSKRDESEERTYKRYYETKQYPDSRNDDRDELMRRYPSQDRKRKDEGQGRSKRGGMSEEERAKRLAEMAAAGAEREEQRGRRVAEQRHAASADTGARPPYAGSSAARALPDSLEARIHSNRHYIQRDRRHMNENFARR